MTMWTGIEALRPLSRGMMVPVRGVTPLCLETAEDDGDDRKDSRGRDLEFGLPLYKNTRKLEIRTAMAVGLKKLE